MRERSRRPSETEPPNSSANCFMAQRASRRIPSPASSGYPRVRAAEARRWRRSPGPHSSRPCACKVRLSRETVAFERPERSASSLLVRAAWVASKASSRARPWAKVVGKRGWRGGQAADMGSDRPKVWSMSLPWQTPPHRWRRKSWPAAARHRDRDEQTIPAVHPRRCLPHPKPCTPLSGDAARVRSKFLVMISYHKTHLDILRWPEAVATAPATSIPPADIAQGQPTRHHEWVGL